MKIITDDDVRSTASMPEIISAVENALIDFSLGKAQNIPRQSIKTSYGTYRVMSAAIPGENVVGTKQGFWTSDTKANVDAVARGEIVSLYDLKSGELMALINSHYLNQIRTGAAGAVGAKCLSNLDSKIACLFGSGRQARAQLLGLCSVRQSIEEIRVFSRDRSNRERFCVEMQGAVRPRLTPVSTSEEALLDADIVIEATSSTQPVFDGRCLKEGCHVTAIGSGSKTAHTLDKETIRRASLFAISSKEQAIAEGMSGLLLAGEDGALQWQKVIEIGDILAGKAAGRRSQNEITVYKANGIGLYDIAAGKAIYDAFTRLK